MPVPVVCIMMKAQIKSNLIAPANSSGGSFRKDKALFFLLILISCCSSVWAQSIPTRTLSGTLTDAATGEQLIAASITTEDGRTGTVTNAYGYFSIQLPAAKVTLRFSSIGYETMTKQVSLMNDLDLGIIKLKEASSTMLSGVTINSGGEKLRTHVKSTQMGVVDLPVSLLKKVPAIGGEVDIIKALQLTPGVKRGGEGTIGMYVRGGNVDENLILLDEATIYNAGHLLGFFSVFNAGAIKDVQLYKSNFPAQYGGRLSSIMDVRMKEGNMQQFHGEGALGIISSNLTLEGPIIKDKASFLVSGRRTYLDVVSGNGVPYHFYDLNGKANYMVNEKNRIYISGYKGDDVLSLKQNDNSFNVNTGLNLGNSAASLRWNHLFNDPRLFSNFSIVYTKFRYNIEGAFDNNNILIASAIRDAGAKADFSFKPNERHDIHFGATLTSHTFVPNIINTSGSISNALKSKPGVRIKNHELALYANDDWKVANRWQLNYGLRLTANITEQGKVYANPEPRVGARYLINERNSIKFSFARMAQYMHLVASSSVALPTDLWYPVTNRIKPGISDQLSLGYYYTIPKKNIAISIEAYYKTLQNQIEYREGAVLLLNNNYEQELITGKGRSAGVEFFATKTAGRFSGWAGYSLSYALRQFDGLNNGKEYYARFDRRHDFSLVGAYDLTKRHAVSFSWVFSSGSPFTAQTGQYLAPSPSFTSINVLPVYGGHNAERLAAANRIDIDYAYKFGIKRKVKKELHFSVYNLLNRAQPGRVVRRLNETTGVFEYKQAGLFGAIPSISLNFKF